MFVYNLPYSKKEFSIKPFLFKHQMDVARLIYEDNYSGLSRYLVNHFEIGDLGIVDKFFVLLKARHLFIGDTLTINVDERSINLKIDLLSYSLFKIENKNRIISYKNLFVEFDYPNALNHDLKQDSVLFAIRSMKIDSEYITFDNLSYSDKESILNNLPASFIKIIREYFSDNADSFVLYEGRRNLLDKIQVDFLSAEPFFIVKNLYSGFPLHYCRDVIRFLSTKMDSQSIMESTPADIKYYLEEYNTEESGQTETDL